MIYFATFGLFMILLLLCLLIIIFGTALTAPSVDDFFEYLWIPTTILLMIALFVISGLIVPYIATDQKTTTVIEEVTE